MLALNHLSAGGASLCPGHDALALGLDDEALASVSLRALFGGESSGLCLRVCSGVVNPEGPKALGPLEGEGQASSMRKWLSVSGPIQDACANLSQKYLHSVGQVTCVVASMLDGPSCLPPSSCPPSSAARYQAIHIQYEPREYEINPETQHGHIATCVGPTLPMSTPNQLEGSTSIEQPHAYICIDYYSLL